MEGLFQPMHLIVILIIVLLIFGPKKLGELGKGLGEGLKGFKDGIKSAGSEPATTNLQNAVPAQPKADPVEPQ